MHTEVPAAEYLPAWQFVQTEAAAAVYLPAVQVWQVAALLPPVSAENLPAAQRSQAALPVIALYVPATHAVQLPLGPVDPASHSAISEQVNGSVVKFF